MCFQGSQTSTVSWSKSQEKKISGIGARYMYKMDLAVCHQEGGPPLGKSYLPTNLVSLVHKDKHLVTPHTMVSTGGWLNIDCTVVMASMILLWYVVMKMARVSGTRR